MFGEQGRKEIVEVLDDTKMPSLLSVTGNGVNQCHKLKENITKMVQYEQGKKTSPAQLHRGINRIISTCAVDISAIT